LLPWHSDSLQGAFAGQCLYRALPASGCPAGFRDDTAALYRALDIFVLPSLREGISNTLLEAMASGRPVIATRVGGNPEIVPEGIAGQLVAPDPEELATAILAYVENPDLMRVHGEGGRAHVLASNFTFRGESATLFTADVQYTNRFLGDLGR